MKKLILLIAIIVSCVTVFAQGQTRVRGYYRSNGTYVQPHYRTLPNNTVSDNWTTKPNVNPYTGKMGTRIYNSYPVTKINYRYKNLYRRGQH